MSFLIYLETNWIVGTVMGQDAFADRLLSTPRDKVSIVLPTICVMEAISAFDWKRIERNKLKEELDRQLKQLQRSGNVEIAQTLVTELTRADLTNARLLSELFSRLDEYLSRIGKRAELLPTVADTIDTYSELAVRTELDRDDALILGTILNHAVDETLKRAFLTGNFKDFERTAVSDLLANVGIKQFRSTERVLEWIESTE